MMGFSINLEAWNALPEDLQQIVKAATRATSQDMLDEYTARNNAALKQLVEEHGVKVLPLPDAVLAELRKTADAVTQEVAAGSDVAQRVMASFVAFREQSQAYHNISERAFYQARDL